MGITSLRSDQKVKPRSSASDRTIHYLSWETLGGLATRSFNSGFREEEYFHLLRREINDIRGEFVRSNNLEFSNEQVKSGDTVWATAVSDYRRESCSTFLSVLFDS